MLNKWVRGDRREMTYQNPSQAISMKSEDFLFKQGQCFEMRMGDNSLYTKV